MKYPQLNSLVPAGEHFDESAINEGVYLTSGHLNSIETQLADHAGALEAVNVQLTEANASVTTLSETATANATTIQTQAARIVELEEQVVKLGAGASGTGSVIKPAGETEVKEERTNDTGKPAYDSADHPANRFADSYKKYDSGLPAKK